MKTQTARTSAVAACLLGAFTALPATASAGQAYGNAEPYKVSVQALQDATHKTDVILTIAATDGSAAPTRSSHVQLKSYDASGNLLWTQNTFGVALTPADGTSTAMQSYTDMQRYQPVAALVQVQNDDSVAMHNLAADATVKLRPDLAADTITAPATVRVNELVNIGALIRELNGDVGATTDVTLLDGDTPIDVVSGLPVLANGSSTAVFTARFTTPGTHTLTVLAGNVQPGDYDTANNSRTFTIDVINPVDALHYTAQYTATRNLNYYYQWSNLYSSGVTTAKGSTENARLTLYGIPGAPAAVTDITVDLGADGTMNPSRHYEVASGAPVTRLDNNTFLYVDAYGSSTTTVQLYTWGGDYVYFSQWHDYYWGTTTTYSSSQIAPALNATTSFDARIVVTSAGQEFGGSLSVPLTSVPEYRSWTDPSGYGYQSDVAIAGAGNGITTP